MPLMAARRSRVCIFASFLQVLLLGSVQYVPANAEVCGEGFYVNASECRPCGAGETNPAGDDTTAGDTNCTDVDGCAYGVQTCNGFCFDDADYAFSFYSCDFFYVNSYCANGGVGSAWDDDWSFDDYRNPDNGISPLDACCECGGGNGVYLNDSDRNANCVDVAAPGSGFACSCSSGWEFNASLQACRPVICPKDYRVQDSSCVACLPGRVHEAGTPAIYGNTLCSNQTCAFNERVFNHSCIECDPGYTNKAGDNAFSDDTACEVWLCAENERVLNNSCVPCAYGGVHPAGDNATGNNTECFFDLCELNQYVVDGKCRDCPPGTYMDERIGTYTQGVNCTIDYCELHQHVVNHTCVNCTNQSGFPLYNPNNDDMSSSDTVCSVYCRIDDLPLPHAGYIVPDREAFPEEMVPLGSSATLGCDPLLAFEKVGTAHQVYCSYAAGFLEYDAEQFLTCGNRDYCEGHNLCASTWGDLLATCIDRDVESIGYDCACNRTGFSSRTLRVNDPFDSSFVQNFTAAMEAVEGAGSDIVVACAYTVCAENEHVVNGTCTTCIPGSVRPAGDATHQGNTECQHIFCAVDEHVVNHTCQPCNTTHGFYNAGSDDSTGPNTECVPRLCTGRYFVENHDCSECPVGKFNPSTNFSNEDRGSCVEFDACTAFVSTFNETSTELPSNGTVNHTTWKIRQSLPCRENGDPQATCFDNRAPDRNRTCVCSAGWQNFSWNTLTSRVPHAYGPNAISSASFASATSLGDAWGQFASEPFFTSAVGYTTCLPLLCQYDEHVVNQSCVACLPGTTREAGDDASIPASEGGNTECSVVVCGANEFVVNHSYAAANGLDNVDFCQPCPPGSTRPAGDNATFAPGTECIPTICGRNQQVVDHACAACAPGTKNTGGGYNAMAHENKECDHILCAEDQYVLAHACYDCAPGMRNDAGDDAAFSKTSCDEIICEKNHYVLPFHVCAPCAVGTTRDAGDYASRDATECDSCAEVITPACLECDSKTECTRCAPGYHLAPADGNPDVTTCMPTICGIDEHVVNYECEPCPANKTNAGGDFAPLNNTACDEVYTVEFNDTYAQCSYTETCQMQVALTYAPLENVTLTFTSKSSAVGLTASRRKLADTPAILFQDGSDSLTFSPENFSEPRRVVYFLQDTSLCSHEGDFMETTIQVVAASLDAHYNSTLNLDPLSVSSYFIRVRCYAQPSVSSFSPPASHMQGGERVSLFGDGFRDDLSVLFWSLAAPLSDEPATCTNVVVLSDNEARCTLPSSQYGYAAVVLTINTTADVLTRNVSSAVENGGNASWYFFERRCISGSDIVVVADANVEAGIAQQEACLPCSVRSFSPYGMKCAPCPEGTDCVWLEEELEGTFVTGSDIPAQREGLFREKLDIAVFGEPHLTFFEQPVGAGGCQVGDAVNGLSCDDVILRSGGSVFCHELEAAGHDCRGCVCGAALQQLSYHGSSTSANCIDGDFNFETRPLMGCRWPSDRCLGGSSCNGGYRNHSWLCAGCDANRTVFHGECWSCSDGWLSMPTINTAVMAAVLLLFCVGIAANRHSLTASLRDLKQLQAGAKTELTSTKTSSSSTSTHAQTSGQQSKPNKPRTTRRNQILPVASEHDVEAGSIKPAGSVAKDVESGETQSESEGKLDKDGEEEREKKDKGLTRHTPNKALSAASQVEPPNCGDSEVELIDEHSRAPQRAKELAAKQEKKIQAKLVKLGGRAWEPYLKAKDSDKYDVMRLRLVVQLKDKIEERLKWSFVILKLLITHVQYIGQMNALLGMRPFVWPVGFSIFVYAFDWVNLHLYILPSLLGCVFPLPPLDASAFNSTSAAAPGVQSSFQAVLLHPDVWYYRALAASVALPLILFAVVGLVSLCQAGKRRVSEAQRVAAEKEAVRLGHPPPVSEKAAAQRASRWTGGLYILLLFFVPVSRTAMEVFACDDYQQSFWMTTDPSAQCYTTPYWVALSVSCIVLALFTFGAPALAIGTVHKNKSLLAESETSRWLGVLYFEYKPAFYYWDALEYTQRFLMLVCVPALIARASPWQPVLSLAIALLFYVLHIKVQPYRAPFLNRVKGIGLLVILLNQFWTCLLMFLPNMMGFDGGDWDDTGLVEASQDVASGQGYLDFYATAWVGREWVGILFDIIFLVPNVFVILYIVMSEQIDQCAQLCVYAAKRRELIRAEQQRLKREKEDLEGKPWALPSKAAVAKFEAELSKLDSTRGGGERTTDKSVGLVVESVATQTDPEASFEEQMEALRKENIALFEKGRGLQATFRNLQKKLASARADASNVEPDLEWRRQKLEDLKAELASIEERNEKLALKKRKQAVVQHADEFSPMVVEQHDANL